MPPAKQERRPVIHAPVVKTLNDLVQAFFLKNPDTNEKQVVQIAGTVGTLLGIRHKDVDGTFDVSVIRQGTQQVSTVHFVAEEPAATSAPDIK